ncbi:MAG: hypothetical protein ACQEWI_06265 [Bacillota bacterium]
MKEAGNKYEVKNIGWDPLFAAVQAAYDLVNFQSITRTTKGALKQGSFFYAVFA